MAAGYHDFVAGETLTAANLEDYCERQATLQFATAAARDSAVAAILTEGLRTHQLDTNTTTVYTGSAWSTVGPVYGTLTSWTPVVVQSNTPTLTVTAASWSRVGRMVHAQALLAITSAGTGANVITVSLPVAAAAAYVSDYSCVGYGVWGDTSDAATGMHFGHLALASTTTVKIYGFPATANHGAIAPSFLGVGGSSNALASGDIISINAVYEAGADA
jgi:hypothetical protein